MNYMTLKEASEKWGVSPRRINYYCSAGRIPGSAVSDLSDTFFASAAFSSIARCDFFGLKSQKNHFSILSPFLYSTINRAMIAAPIKIHRSIPHHVVYGMMLPPTE